MDNLSRNAKDKDGEAIFQERPSLHTKTSLVCLNFKVPLRVRQQFKIYAAQHNMTMTDLLLRLLADELISDDGRGKAQRVHKQEIKK